VASLRGGSCRVARLAISRSLDPEPERETEPQRVHRDPALPAPYASKPRRQIIGDGQNLAPRSYECLNLKGAAARLRQPRPAVAAQIAC
jgi:hypothetical protein